MWGSHQLQMQSPLNEDATPGVSEPSREDVDNSAKHK